MRNGERFETEIGEWKVDVKKYLMGILYELNCSQKMIDRVTVGF